MTREEAITWCDRFNDAWANADPEDDFPDLKYSDTLDQLFYLAGQALRQQETVTNRNGLKVVEIDQVKPLTNADHIRSMSDEELAEFLWGFNLADVSTVKMGEFGPHMFRYRLKEWLQQPAEEDDHGV